MKPVAFEYARAADADAAVAHLVAADGAGKVLAGGQSRGPMLNLRRAQPRLLVDVRRIEALREVRADGDHVFVGACVTHARIEDRAVEDASAGLLPNVAASIAYRAIRNRGTVGGSVSHADPAADWVSVFALLDAQAVIAGPSGTRSLPMDEFFLGAFETALGPADVLLGMRYPRASDATRWGYWKLTRKPVEFSDAIGAWYSDPARDHFRAVVGATSSRPIVIDGDAARELAARSRNMDLNPLLTSAGIEDPVERQWHRVALCRALERMG